VTISGDQRRKKRQGLEMEKRVVVILPPGTYFWRSQGALRGQGKQLIKIICQNKHAKKAEMPERG